MASASGYNHHRFARAVLKKSRRWEASLTVELLPNFWRFEHSYNGPMTPFLLALRSQVIPPSLIPFLYDIRPPISFYDGCLVVELHDLRKTPETRSRVVMRPAPEALAQTIDVMLERTGTPRNEELALELESRIIAATSPPLYLGTSILPARNAALAIALTTPAHPNVSSTGSYRNPQGNLGIDDKSESEVLRKLMHAGERTGSGMGNFQPKWSILRVKEMLEERAARAGAEAMHQQQLQGLIQQAQQQNGGGQPGQQGQGGGGMGQGGAAGGGGQAGGENKPKKNKKKRVAAAEEETGKDAAAGGAAGGPSKPKKKKIDAGDKKKPAGGPGKKKAATAAA